MTLPIPKLCEIAGLPVPVAEFRFHPARKWRFDFAWVEHKLALDVDGGVFIQGRHSRGLGMERDHEKMAEALCLGWRVLRVTPRQIRSGQALDWLTRAVSQASSL